MPTDFRPIVVQREWKFSALNANVVQRELRSASEILIFTERHGLRASYRGPNLHKSKAKMFWLALEGDFVVCRANGAEALPPGRWLEMQAGDRLESRHSSTVMVQWVTTTPWMSLRLQENPCHAESFYLLQMLRFAMRAQTSSQEIAQIFSHFLSASDVPSLDLGLSFDDGRMDAVAQAVAHLSCKLSDYPDLNDLGSLLSMRTRDASASAVEYFQKYHASIGSWREYLAQLRASLAEELLRKKSEENSAVTTDTIAQILGYRSASALYHRLRDSEKLIIVA